MARCIAQQALYGWQVGGPTPQKCCLVLVKPCGVVQPKGRVEFAERSFGLHHLATRFAHPFTGLGTFSYTNVPTPGATVDDIEAYYGAYNGVVEHYEGAAGEEQRGCVTTRSRCAACRPAWWAGR